MDGWDLNRVSGGGPLPRRPKRGVLSHGPKIALSLLVGAVVLVAACGTTAPASTPSSASATPTATPPTNVSFAYQVGYNYGMYYVAQQHGWLKSEGINLSPMTIFQSGPPELDALLAGQFDVAVLGFVPVLTLANEVPGTLRVIDVVDNSGTTYSLVAQKGITSVADLRGKTVAVTVGSNYEYFLDQVLAKYGMTESDIHVVNAQPNDGQAAFTAGRVDAVVPATIDTQSLVAQTPGSHVLFSGDQFTASPNPSPNPFAIYDLVVTSTAFANAHPALLTKLIQVFHEKVTPYVSDHFTSAATDILNWQTNVVKATVTLAQVEAGLKGYDFYSIPQVQQIMAGGLLKTSLTSVSQYLVSAKLLPSVPDLSTLIDPQYVNAA